MNLKSIRLFFLILLAYLKKCKWWIIGGVSVVFVLIILQLKFNFLSPKNEIKLGLVGTYQEHDLPEEVTKLISSGLVEASGEGRLKPNLVTGWEVNNDATEFRFKLKENLRWSDNTKVKSQDIELNIPNTTISYPDERVIQFNLKESYSPLPSLLVKPVFKKGALLGIGSYKIATCRFLLLLFPRPCIDKSRIFISKIILQPNDPKLPKVYIRFYPSEKVAVTGFQLGEVQALFGINKLQNFSKNPVAKIKQATDYSKVVAILFQTTESLLQNRSLRQALAYQAPQITGEEKAGNPYPPNMWAYNSESKKYLSNAEEAVSALTRAKSQISKDLMKKEIILTSTPNLEEVGNAVISAWKELGVDVKLRVESGVPQNFQALLITQSIPLDPDQYSLWHATQTKTNLTKYDSKRADKNLEDGRKAIKEEDRKAKYLDFQKTLLEDAPAIFLYFPKYNIVYLKKAEQNLNKLLNL